MIVKLKKKRLSHNKFVILGVAIVLVAALIFFLSVFAESGDRLTVPQSEPACDTPSITEQVKVNILSISAILAAITTILVTITKVYKPIRKWFVRRIRSALEIVDVNKKIDDRFDSIERSVSEHADMQRKEYAIMSGQNEQIEKSLGAVLSAIEEINEKINNVENSNRAVMKDVITKTYYKYARRRAIPIHEKENISKMFEIYEYIGGNSYVAGLMQKMDEWEVLSGEDVPPPKDEPRQR